MKNPFKYGTIVEGEFFTDRIDELKEIRQLLDSENHLILISPRRFGKSSLVQKAVKESSRPYFSLNLQNVISVEDFASKLLREIFRIYPMERIKHLMTHFRFIPTVSSNPVTNVIDVSFQPVVNGFVLIEDAFALIEKVSREDKRLIVILDEFQEIMSIRKGLDKQLRSIMQGQQHLNYILLGSQESMMTEIFERKKSPFYHFGKLIYLDKIPYSDFKDFIVSRLPLNDKAMSNRIADEMLSFTNLHPYYTQQLSSEVWDILSYDGVTDGVVRQAISKIVQSHDLDFERLWQTFNRTDRHIMQSLSNGISPLTNRQVATSTSFSAVKRMMKNGFVIRVNDYEIEDPFFKEWILKSCL